MRLFIALPIPPDVAVTATSSFPDLPGLRRVRPEHLHVTLAFLGAVADDRVNDVLDATRMAAAAYPAFTIRLDAVGRFPETGAPRILWLGMGKGATESTNIAAAVRRALTGSQLSFDDKPFRPHVTVARVTQDADRPTVRAIAATAERLRVPTLEFPVDAVIAYESVLSPKGPRYTARIAAPLGASNPR
ncbi:MAG TPA: RNA 2',3'-cyclic phosphodiesterase [Candidatus Limnocylindrales bacterium]|nr:RNA 2',3'-cyclic phosphodiesterase [Candidatus Limnocylindrales bacterium]